MCLLPKHGRTFLRFPDSPRLLSRSKGRVGNALRVLSLSPPQLYERQEQLAALPDDALSRESFKEIQRGALGEVCCRGVHVDVIGRRG